MYKILDESTIKRLPDGACIPMVDGNMEYEEVKAWLAEGNTLLPADIPSIEQQVAEINADCRRRIFAKYDSEKQLSFGQGLYPLAMREACQQWIDGHIAESNRLSDCITAGDSAIPNWPV